jgi:hypothetical protein
MLAPYFPRLLVRQSDFGYPAGAVLGDVIVSDFPQNLACGANRSTAARVRRPHSRRRGHMV